MMEYEFIDKSTLIAHVGMGENIDSYPTYQEQQDNHFKSTSFDNHLIPTSDIWQSSWSNSNTNDQSFYFPSSFDSKNYHMTDHHYCNYQPSFDIPSTSLLDSYAHVLPNHYSIESYSAQTGYNSPTIESSIYFTPTDSYQNYHSIYTDPNIILPSSVSTQWDFDANRTPPHDVATSTSNSSKQPCSVCQEESSGYHFGAYTCESCKAFYRRITRDPNIAVRHSCDTPLLTITKSNRKDCRACRKEKCDQVGMTILPKDRALRTKSTSRPCLRSINILLEQLGHDLISHQLSTSTALENLFNELDFPSIIPNNFDYHSLYMNAIQIWRNQHNYSSQLLIDISLKDTFAVLLFLFYFLIMIKENTENKFIHQMKFEKLLHILQEEIHRFTGMDHRLARRIKALFMKCYVALAQYYPNNTNLCDDDYH